MRYRLGTLMILAGGGPPAIAFLWFFRHASEPLLAWPSIGSPSMPESFRPARYRGPHLPVGTAGRAVLLLGNQRMESHLFVGAFDRGH